MSVAQLTPADLCRRLTQGWKAENAEIPRELLGRLSARWQANVELQESAGPSAYRAALELNRLRLLGALDFGCLVLGPGANVEREVATFWQQQGGIGRLAIILAATPAIREAAQQATPSVPCLFLADGEIEALLSEPGPLEVLKRHLRKHIPIRRLVPYDFMHPAAPNMFFGRRDLLERLRSEATTSFAIAGPGRIGKSSLLRQYRYELRRDLGDDRRHRLVRIDCYPYGNLSADTLARRIALDISADSEANRVNSATLLRFLKHRSWGGEKPIELLFDEVDSVCLNPAFAQLGEAVHNNYCRVILCGKGNLHRMVRKKETRFAQRLELIQPEPLDEESAKRLLVEPLSDLGFTLQDKPWLCEGVLQLTQRRPHLIQACAKRLVELALGNQNDTITPDHLRQLQEEFTAMSYATLPLEDLEDDLTRCVSLLWLRAGGGEATVSSLQKLAEQSGISLPASKALDICYELWICNVLSCERGVFAPASPQLVQFVRKMDFGKEITRLIQTLAPSQRVRAGLPS
jgi:hypothetical protein